MAIKKFYSTKAKAGAITGRSDSRLILHDSHAARESRKTATNIPENLIS